MLLHHFLFHQNQVLDTLNNGPLIGAGFKIQTVLWQGIELKMSNPALDYQVTLYLNFARVGGFHRQEEPLIVIRSDASSRKAGELKGDVVVCYFEPLITQHMAASGSPSG